ncbi:Cell cycle checkpoint protein RAD17 [Liparis tanakae]|uniref:Cell cycle checkpoint protein RAD17 n=1 Tax=Liparis tanakae TaxID=230148 RepID=A0A4Z2EHB3_9TELE|nr:Cell cycle checkpoint protein RAD17 [Liparis tanakae]
MDKPPVGEKAALSRPNRWVDPSFADLPEESFAPSSRRRGSQASCSKAEPKRSRRRAGEPDPRAAHLPKDSAPGDQDEPWVDRYSPRSQAELAVHKKKIEEVENWLRVHSSSSKGGVLLLTGPSGCGKTATVQLAQFQDFLLRANKYNCLKMVGDGAATDGKLILVEVRGTAPSLADGGVCLLFCETFGSAFPAHSMVLKSKCS